MECWTIGDAIVYILCVILAVGINLSPFAAALVFIQLFYFLLVLLPYRIVTEFKLRTFDKRHANRGFTDCYELVAIVFTQWVLSTFTSEVARNVFFGEMHARILFAFRKFKYGTENTYDFTFDVQPSEKQIDGFVIPRGYWIYSKCRKSIPPDLLIYFVPGDLAGSASPFLYLEFLCVMMVELQVQGFHNPKLLCVDVHPMEFRGSECGFAQYINTVANGWKYASHEFPTAKTLFLGSGIGGTAQLSLLLHMARPFIGVGPQCNSLTGTKLERRPSDSSTPNNSPEHSRDQIPVDSIDLENYTHNLFNDVESSSDGSGLEEKSLYPSIPADLPKPDTMLLISPLGRVKAPRTDRFPDIVSGKAFNRLGQHLVSEAEEACIWTMPSCIRDNEWWKEALPSYGSVVVYGGVEIVADEVLRLVEALKAGGLTKVLGARMDEGIHGWPITKSFLASDSTLQLYGITQIADHIAKMLVMECLCAHISKK